MLCMPESPGFLISQGDYASAKRSLHRLRGKDYANLEEELDDIRHRVEDAREVETGCRSVPVKQLFTSRIYLKPFALVFGLFAFQQLSGINAYVFYLQDIFIKAGSDIDPGLSASIVALTMVRNLYLTS